MTARAYPGMAVVILEFDVNFDKQKALEDVRAKVDEARGRLPHRGGPAGRAGDQHACSR